jgi:hypothetical protein
MCRLGGVKESHQPDQNLKLKTIDRTIKYIFLIKILQKIKFNILLYQTLIKIKFYVRVIKFL